jgi:hypothetical protein
MVPVLMVRRRWSVSVFGESCDGAVHAAGLLVCAVAQAAAVAVLPEFE